MKTTHQLSVAFDSSKLVKDLKRIKTEWTKHFNTGYYTGDWKGIQLRKSDDEFHDLSPGSLSSTKYIDTSLLKELTYIQEVLSWFQCDKTSVRLLKLSAGSEIKEHKDTDLNFFDGDVRVHVPIQTNKEVLFSVDNTMLKMEPGQCWYADFSQPHWVRNNGNTDRIHLVIDLKVNDWLIALFESEGILKPKERKPNPIERHDKQTKKEIMKSLLLMGTETSKQLAQDLKLKYDL